jgi:hypothetical protein
MPCNSEYQEPNECEIENAKVLALLEELKTGKLPKWHGDGSYSKVYNNTTQELLDKNTEKLCSNLQKLTPNVIKGASLEMQIWWRDHQEADKKRIKAELKAISNEKLKAKAISKLTSHERKLLGL